jgi:hypothetical protein
MRAEKVSPETKKSIEKLYNQKLSEKQVFKARNNLIGFFSLLISIDKEINRNKHE